MGLSFRKRINLGKHIKINVGKRGISTSIKIGNINYNTKRSISTNLGNGITYRVSKKAKKSSK